MAADRSFSTAVIRWQKQHGRHKLPWQNTRDAYRVWLSEIMLQQTQVAAVIPYYQRFLERFPDVGSLAAAPADEVMAHWSGLGYYSRARNLHRCAQRICAEYNGVFPADADLLVQLPGIGRSTAAAISAFAYGRRAAILDGNVKRVFCRNFGIDGYPGEKRIEDSLWRHAEALLPERDIEAYTQGLMDLGATLCTRNNPSCPACPMLPRCVAVATDRVKHLPVRKPKKAVPEKHAAMLVVIDRGQVLLEQRPESGIWGGLLSLPELAGPAAEARPAGKALPDMAISNAIARFGTVASCEALQSFTHGFTHFKLHISPFRISLAHRIDFVGEGSHVWYDGERLSRAPLPAPVKKLLLEIFNGTAQLKIAI
ncbi:MAG: A/G-specific adenine glycosylase [Burkholderiales bacterium RIFCSPLOWO2_02_FULL_57_36]|nr:MAG: A/G-specific adenine glycosylase [Burkholderiales bacterium RIFCSPLOWO2_02_FULL_57_36]